MSVGGPLHSRRTSRALCRRCTISPPAGSPGRSLPVVGAFRPRLMYVLAMATVDVDSEQACEMHGRHGKSPRPSALIASHSRLPRAVLRPSVTLVWSRDQRPRVPAQSTWSSCICGECVLPTLMVAGRSRWSRGPRGSRSPMTAPLRDELPRWSLERRPSPVTRLPGVWPRALVRGNKPSSHGLASRLPRAHLSPASQTHRQAVVLTLCSTKGQFISYIDKDITHAAPGPSLVVLPRRRHPSYPPT